MSVQLQDDRLREGGELTGYLGGRAAFAGRDHDEQLHDCVIDGGTAGLDDEDILLSNTVEDLDACLALQRRNMVSQVTLQQRLVAVAVAVVATADGALQTWRQAQGRLAPTLENCESSASAGGMPRLSHILLVRTGQDEPAKIRVLRIVSGGGWRRKGKSARSWKVKYCRFGGQVPQLNFRRSSTVEEI